MSLPPPHLREHLHVEALEGDQVAVTVVLPSDLVRDYCNFLDSLSSFFYIVKNKTTVAQAQAKAAARILDQRAEQALADYRSRVVSAFDRYTAQGLSRKEAIKRIAAELRAEDHPWRFPDLVRATLVEAGRGHRGGRPRRVGP